MDRKDGRLPWLCPGMTGRIPCIPRGHGHISHSSRFPSRQQPCVLPPPPPFLFDQRHHYLSYILPFSSSSFFFFNSIFYSASTIKSIVSPPFFPPRLPFRTISEMKVFEIGIFYYSWKTRWSGDKFRLEF